MNYFELFDIRVSFLPDKEQVKKQFYLLSRKYHPDFFTRESSSEQEDALERSSQVNKAYKIFQNKDETIRYVLQLEGLLEEEEKYDLPPDFLMEMLDLNEQKAEAAAEGAGMTDELRAEIGRIENEIYEPVKEIIESYKAGETSRNDLLRVKEYYMKKKYLNRILAGH